MMRAHTLRHFFVGICSLQHIFLFNLYDVKMKIMMLQKVHVSIIWHPLNFAALYIYISYIPVLCDELFYKFIHRRERSKFASSRYPLLYLGNILEIWCMERGALLRGAGGAGQGALQGWPDIKKWVFLMVFPFIWV